MCWVDVAQLDNYKFPATFTFAFIQNFTTVNESSTQAYKHLGRTECQLCNEMFVWVKAGLIAKSLNTYNSLQNSEKEKF